MYKCSHCGGVMSYPQDYCPHCNVLLNGIKCNSCGYLGSKTEFIENNHLCPKCGIRNTIRDYPSSNKSWDFPKLPPHFPLYLIFWASGLGILLISIMAFSFGISFMGLFILFIAIMFFAAPIFYTQRGKQKVVTGVVDIENRFIPKSFKIYAHILSLIPGVILGLLLVLSPSKDPASPIGNYIFTLLGFPFIFIVIYYFSGGFEWKKEKFPIWRILCLALFSGFGFYLIFLAPWWYLVRYVMAKYYKIPFVNATGRLYCLK